MTEQRNNPALFQALRAGDPDEAAALIEAGADVRYVTDTGYDALIDAAHGRDVQHDALLMELLQLLIDNGVRLNGRSDWSESGLSVLSRIGRFDAVQLLLKAGAPPEYLEFTPLMEAVVFGAAADVQAQIDSGGGGLEERDWWERTAWIIAVQIGDIAKAQLLLDVGCDKSARGRCGQPALFYAIEGGSLAMLRWLLQIGIDISQTNDFGSTALDAAVEADEVNAVDLLLSAGVDVDQRIRTRGLDTVRDPEIAELFARLEAMPGGKIEYDAPTALNDARSREVALRLLQAGADPQQLTSEGCRAILGYPPEQEGSLLTASVEEYREFRVRRFGTLNPEQMNNPFWIGMIRSGLTAYGATAHYGDVPDWDSDYEPTWCAHRFGQSITFLPDGRIVQVGGEHEDGTDPDFCIYNDVFVHTPDGAITLYGYPESVFPPTDFHTATLVGEWIYLIGSVGYPGERAYGIAPVCRLSTMSFAIEPLQTTGENPGWISRHKAVLINGAEIQVSGGKAMTSGADRDDYARNASVYTLDTKKLDWRRAGAGG